VLLMSVIGIIGCLVFFLVYQRYIPVVGVKKVTSCQEVESAILIDVRDFHEVKTKPCEDALHIPLPYLKRQYGDIPKNEVVIIVSDAVLKNLTVRQLSRKGVRVKGYWCL
jgi:rhodanese-related sulfurtransferase